MKNYKELAIFHMVVVAVLSVSSPVFAAGGGTLGSAIGNTVTSLGSTPGLLTALSYLVGIILGIMGIYKLKEHVESPGNTPIWEPVKRFLAGGGFFALPAVIEAAYNTVGKGLTDQSNTGFLGGGASGNGLDAMMVKLMGDIGTPFGYLMGAFAYLAGIILIMIGISRLLKSEQDGPRGPAGIGTVMTFLIGGALLASEELMGAVSSSFFGTAAVKTKGMLQYTSGLEDGGAHANAVIAAIVAFMTILGWISFLRGFFIIRGVAEGDSQSSPMAGITHILGGALAVNIGPVLNAVQTTLGITDYGIKFS